MQCGILCVSDDPTRGVFVPFEKLFGDLSASLKDGFDRLDKRMDRFEQQLALKADNTRVAELAKDLADRERRVDERLAVLELASAGVTAVSKYKWAFWGLAIAALTAISTLVWLAVGGSGHS
jgi:hypothetical protein